MNQSDRAHGRVRWGVVGLGVGAAHAREILGTSDWDLVALCDRNEEVLLGFEPAELGIQRFRRQEDLLEQAGIDALVVASYDSEHADLIVQALNLGIHVFAEKPLATSEADLRAVVDALNAHPRVRLTTNTLLRQSPRFRELKRRIAKGDLGTIAHVEADYLYGRLQKLAWGWRGTDPGYSVTLGGAIHMVDLLIWLTGERPTRIVGMGGRRGIASSLESASSPFGGDDTRLGLLEFASGMTAKVSANYSCVQPHFHRLDVFGSLGTFLHTLSPHGTGSPTSSALLYTSRDPTVPPEDLGLAYPGIGKGVLLGGFADAINGIGSLEVDEQQAVDALAVCLALDRACQDGGFAEVVTPAVKARRGL